MKLRNIAQLIGFKSKAKKYSYYVDEFTIDEGKAIRYARWNHPSEARKPLPQALFDAYREHIAEGDFCIDIGAHTGDTTIPMGVAAGTTGCVLGLEPNPMIYHVLEKNARANKSAANIETIMAAATPEEGFIEFEYSDSGFCNGGRHEGISAWTHGHAFKQSVYGINLEEELREHYADRLGSLTFIKTDAEGYDLYVLQSIKGILREAMPVIKAEIFKKTDAAYRTQILEFLTGLGYRVYKVKAEPMEQGEEMSVENIAVGTHYDILCLPPV